MLHFEPGDQEKEDTFARKIASDIKVNGVFCNLMLQSSRNGQHLKELLTNTDSTWGKLNDSYVEYVKLDVQYHMYIVKKLSE